MLQVANVDDMEPGTLADLRSDAREPCCPVESPGMPDHPVAVMYVFGDDLLRVVSYTS